MVAITATTITALAEVGPTTVISLRLVLTRRGNMVLILPKKVNCLVSYLSVYVTLVLLDRENLK